MTISEAVRGAIEDYCKKYLDYPKDVYMSNSTLYALNGEITEYMNVFVMGGVNRIYGMRINEKDYLPTGVVVVGGCVCNVSEGKEG